MVTCDKCGKEGLPNILMAVKNAFVTGSHWEHCIISIKGDLCFDCRDQLQKSLRDCIRAEAKRLCEGSGLVLTLPDCRGRRDDNSFFGN